MERYTTEWAKEYLREHPSIDYLAQDEDGQVYEYEKYEPTLEKYYWDGLGDVIDGRFTMLEHPDGWQNSKVTREML